MGVTVLRGNEDQYREQDVEYGLGESNAINSPIVGHLFSELEVVSRRARAEIVMDDQKGNTPFTAIRFIRSLFGV